MEKKRLYIIVSTMLIVFLGITAWRYFRSEKYFLSRLPEKYSSYPAVNEKIDNTNYQIIPLFTGARPRALYRDSVNNNIIVESVEEFKAKEYEQPTYSVTYYRIDSTGKPLDSLNETGSTAFGRPFNGHLLYADHYSDYLKTGKHQKIGYKNINKDLAMAPEALSSLVKELLSKADGVTVYEEENPMTYIMSVDGEVLQVFVPKTSDISVPTEYENNFHQLLPATDYSHKTGLKHYAWDNPKSAITLDYFLKQKYQSGSYFSMAAAPSSRLARWYGMGYFLLKIGSDTIKFKHPISFLLADNLPSGGYYHNGEWGTLDLFNQHMKGFKILTVGYNNNHFHELDGCYLVVPVGN